MEEGDGATMFVIAEKQQKNDSKFFFRIIVPFIQLLQNNVTMEHQKILNLLNDRNDSKFVTGKESIINDIEN